MCRRHPRVRGGLCCTGCIALCDGFYRDLQSFSVLTHGRRAFDSSCFSPCSLWIIQATAHYKRAERAQRKTPSPHHQCYIYLLGHPARRARYLCCMLIASQKRNACIMRVTLNGKEKLFRSAVRAMQWMHRRSPSHWCCGWHSEMLAHAKRSIVQYNQA